MGLDQYSKYGNILFAYTFQTLLDMKYSSVLLIAIAICLYIYKYCLEDRILNLPPGPLPLPIVGNLLSLGLDARKPLLKLKQLYGDVFTLYMGSRRVVFLNSYNAIKDAFVKNGQAFSGRPHDLIFFQQITDGKGMYLCSTFSLIYSAQCSITMSV